MAKQYKVLVNAGKEADNRIVEVPRNAATKGAAVHIKAKAGAKYQLQEIAEKNGDKNVAPDYVKTKRVGKDLHIIFEGDKEPSVIIDDYYKETADGFNGLIGQAENGSFYEYIPEDPNVEGLVPNLRDGAEAVNVALGGNEVQAAGAAVGLLLFNPLLAGLGLLGAAAAAGGGGGAAATTAVTPTGALATASDSGLKGDNKTNIATPALTGKATPGSTVEVQLNGKTYTTTANANGDYTVNITDKLPDGTYNPVIKVTSGGTSTSINATPFTIDSTTTVLITNTGAAGTVRPISGTAEAGDTVVLTDKDGKVIGSTTAGADGKWSITPTTAVPAGTLTATATDVSGNTATNLAPTGALQLDGTSDSGTLGDNKTNVTTPALTGKATPGATVEVLINGKTYTTTADAKGDYSLVVKDPLPDGTYTPIVKVTNPSGTSSISATPFTVDTTTSVNIESAGTAGAPGTAKPISGTAEPGAVVLLKDNVGSIIGSTTAGPDGRWSLTPTKTVPDGKITATATDPAGNTATDTDSNVVATPNVPTISSVVDNVAGVTGVVQKFTPGATGDIAQGNTNDTTPTINGTATPGSVVKIYDNGTLVGSTTAGTDGKWSFEPTLTAEGVHKFAVSSAAATAPETATYDINLDTTAPAKPQVDPTNNNSNTGTGTGNTFSVIDNVGATKGVVPNQGTTDDNSPVINGKGTPGDIVKIYDNGVVIGSTTVDPDGKWSFKPTTPLTDGTHAIATDFTDPAGNTSTKSDPVNFTIDTNATAVSLTNVTDDVAAVTGSVPHNGTTNDSTPTISGKGTPGTVVTIKDGNIPLGSTTVLADGTWSFTPSTALAEGTHNLNATGTDSAGNTSTTGSFPIKVDTTAPVAPSIDSATDDVGTAQGTFASGVPTDDSTPTLTGKAEAGSIVSIKDANGNVVGSTTADANGKWSYTLPALPADGTYKYTASTKDAAGNTSPDSAPFIVKLDTSVANGGQALGLTIDTDANNDGQISFAEIGNTNGTPNTNLTVTATFDKTKVNVGDVITFTDTATGGAVKTVTLDANMVAAGKATATFTSPGDGNNFNVKANLKNPAGNTTPDANDTAKLDLSNLNPDPNNNPGNKANVGITITTDANNDGTINVTELAGKTKVDVKITLPTDAKAGDTLIVTGTGNDAQTIVLTSDQITAKSVTTSFTAPANGSKIDVTAQVSDTAGNKSAIATDTATVNTTPAGAPTPVITTDGNSDGFINKTELGTATKVSVKTTLPSGAAVNDVITVTDGTTVSTHKLTSADLTNGFVTDNNVFTAPANGGKVDINATLTTVAGNVSAAGTASAKIDTSNFANPTDATKSALVVNIDTDANNDGLISNAELSSSSNTVKATITLAPEAAVGDTLTVKASGNTDRVITLAQGDITAGKVVITDFNPTGNNTTFNVSASLKDQAGNATPTPDAADSATLKSTISGAPVVTITEDGNNDGTISKAELSGNVDITIGLPQAAVAGDTLTITLNGGTPEVYTLTSADINNHAVTRAVSAPAEGGTVTAKATLTDAAGNVTAAGTDSAVLDTTAPNGGAAPTLVITTDINNDGLVSLRELADTNGDGTVSAAELAAATSFNVKTSFDKTKVVAGDKIVYSDGTSVTLNATDVSNGFINTAFTKPAEGGTLTLSATVQDSVGNASTASATDSAKLDTMAPTQTVSFSSMTKDSGLTAGNADWLTADGSAGRLVSGTVSAPLAAGDSVVVFVNKNDGTGPQPVGASNGIATVSADGKAWEITDPNGYNAGWTYSAVVIDAAGNTGSTTSQLVNTDFTEVAPVITGVKDVNNAGVANAGSTTQALSSVSGTGNPGSTIFLYDNSSKNLVGTATVASDNTWTVSGLSAVGGSHTFSAKQVDALGNESVLSKLWTVTSPVINQVTNSGFDQQITAAETEAQVIDSSAAQGAGTSAVGVGSNALWDGTAVKTLTDTAVTTWNHGTSFSKSFTAAENLKLTGGPTFNTLKTGNMLLASLDSVTTEIAIWKQTVNVVAGKTYTFSFDYGVSTTKGYVGARIDNDLAWKTEPVSAGSNYGSEGTAFITYTATTTGPVVLKIVGVNGATGVESGNDFIFDDVTFTLAATPADGSLTENGTPPSTPQADTLTYTGGLLSTLGGGDTITVPQNVQNLLTAGGMIRGGSELDTLKLSAGTKLDLTALTKNQTVQSIQEVEAFQMQGGSSLTLSANDVLSLGQTNAFTSNGKVQVLITGTTADQLNLKTLATDGVTTNGVLGNTGLGGEWVAAGTVVANDGKTYNVFNHSTTNAQVLTDMTASTESAVVAFSSMTKDSGPALGTADWLTADGSAGRLISGTLATPLAAGSVVKVFSNGTLLGNATVNAAGTAWEITDTAAHSANWTYRADVVNSSNVVTGSATQVVTTDFTEGAPVITSVTDSANASIANAGTTANALSTVTGTGVAGDTIYLYDNTSTNLVGSATVGSNGVWAISNLNVGAGSNTFSAKQVDAQGNESVLSNTWTVSTAGTNLISNGDFANVSAFNGGLGTKLTGANWLADTSNYALQDTSTFLSVVSATSTSAPAAYAGGTWSKSFVNSIGRLATMTGNVLVGNAVGAGTTWSSNVDVVAGKTYQFSFDYDVNFNVDAGSTSTKGLRVFIDGTAIDVVNTGVETGRFVATYTATSTRTISLSTFSDNTRSSAPNNAGDYALDNFTFVQTVPANNSTLVAGTSAPGTAANNTALTYSAGSLDALAGDDTITASTDLQSQLVAGGFIDGGAGLDTLKLSAGTKLDLTALTNNQTVKAIQQVEAFQMQGNSSLTLSANDVLSLGQTDAFTSNGKVQMLITGTTADQLNLKTLATDGKTTNGVLGNTGLGGEWVAAGTVVANDGKTYNVFNHSTTKAQVLTDMTASTESSNVAFTSMSKDSGALNADWLTADGSAGRVISGTLATPLAAGSVVKIFSNGTLLGNATVNTAGTAWEITDTAAHGANWTYRADVVNSSNVVTGSATQVVTTDLSEAAPVITAVADSSSASIANAGTTTKSLGSVFGTGAAGDTIYLFDNSANNLVGTTTVGADGKWTISGLSTNTAVGGGSNTFAAVQVDAANNVSGQSNLWTVRAGGTNLVANGDFNTVNDFTGVGLTGSVIDFTTTGAMIIPLTAVAGTPLALSTLASGTGTATGGSAIAWSVDGASGSRGAADINATIRQVMGLDNTLMVSVNGSTTTGVVNLYTSKSFQVEKGKSYAFSLNYFSDDWTKQSPTVVIDGVSMTLPSRVGAGETQYNTGTLTGTYVANETKLINIAINGDNTGNGAQGGDFFVDDINFLVAPPVATNSLTAGNALQNATDAGDLSLTYLQGLVSGKGGNDTITATGTDIQAKLAAGGFIGGGAGLDTLKLAAGTTLDLTALTSKQTVKSIQEVEVFEMQGSSSLTLSANDVLSLGQTDAFSGSAGKVQLMIKGTNTDSVALQNLLSDGAGGNTALAGMWVKSANTVTVNSVTFNVFDHSTTGAQVLVQSAISSVSISASPLVLDLNGDGVQTTDLAHGAQFDLMNAGSKQSVAWVEKHDGLLAIDLNHDGQINSGAELLGTSTKLADGSLARDGWQALAQYDGNADGVIDAKDAVFKDLQVWVDGNGDGASGQGEVKSLADLGIQSINLHHDNAQASQNDNVLQGFSSYTTTDGQTHQVTDAWLNTQVGGTAVETFKLVDTGMTLDLTAAHELKNVATVDLTGTGANTLKLDVNALISLSDVLDNAATSGADESKMLVINGNSDDKVELVGGDLWSTKATGLSAADLESTFGADYNFTAGHTYAQHSLNGATVFRDELVTLNLV